jgi:hypothetical protein
MTRRRKAYESPRLVALTCSLLAIGMAHDPETRMAMRSIIAATEVGANIEYLKQRTGYDIDKICPLADRLREANIWHGKSVDAREWLPVPSYRYRMSILLAQALVARGLLQRQLQGYVAIYLNNLGEEKARIPIPEGSSWCRRFSAPLDSALILTI